MEQKKFNINGTKYTVVIKEELEAKALKEELYDQVGSLKTLSHLIETRGTFEVLEAEGVYSVLIKPDVKAEEIILTTLSNVPVSNGNPEEDKMRLTEFINRNKKIIPENEESKNLINSILEQTKQNSAENFEPTKIEPEKKETPLFNFDAPEPIVPKESAKFNPITFDPNDFEPKPEPKVEPREPAKFTPITLDPNDFESKPEQSKPQEENEKESEESQKFTPPSINPSSDQPKENNKDDEPDIDIFGSGGGKKR